jgi:large subunit ribosomal protein L10
VAYTSGDPVALAKALSTWMQENAEFTFKLGIIDGQVITVEEVKQLATMPSKEQIFSKLLFLINAPAQRLVTVMNAVGRDVAVVLNQAVEQGKFAAPSAPAKPAAAEAAPVAEAPKAESVAVATPAETAPVEAAPAAEPVAVAETAATIAPEAEAPKAEPVAMATPVEAVPAAEPVAVAETAATTAPEAEAAGTGEDSQAAAAATEAPTEG